MLMHPHKTPVRAVFYKLYTAVRTDHREYEIARRRDHWGRDSRDAPLSRHADTLDVTRTAL